MANLSPFQMKIKAETIVQNLEMDLSKLMPYFSDDASQEGARLRIECVELIRQIKLKTATNTKIARFLEIAPTVGLL